MLTFLGVILGLLILALIAWLADRSIKKEAKRWGYDPQAHARAKIALREKRRTQNDD